MSTPSQAGAEGVRQPRAAVSAATILVVDDNEDDVILLRHMLKRSQVRNPLQHVVSLDEAMCYLKGQGAFLDRQAHPFPALLIIDSHLPDGSGFDLLRWLKVHRPQWPLAAVMLTGSDIQSYNMSYALGAQSFLTKPLKFEDFANMVRTVRGIKLVTAPDGYVLEAE